jgi:uracil-DNA glycosylase
MGRIRKTTLQGRTKQNSDYRFLKIPEPAELLTAPTKSQSWAVVKIEDYHL